MDYIRFLENREQPAQWPKEVKIMGYTLPILDEIEVKERIANIEWYTQTVVVELISAIPAPRPRFMDYIFGPGRKYKQWQNKMDEINRQNNTNIIYARGSLALQVAGTCGCPVEAVIITEMPEYTRNSVKITAKAPVVLEKSNG